MPRANGKAYDRTKVYYVYKLRVEDCKLPFYVGKGKGDRVRDHIRKDHLAKHSHKNSIIRKAMLEGKRIRIEYVASELTEKQALDLEVKTIALYGRRCNDSGCLANVTPGGEGHSGFKHTDESREKMIERRKLRTVPSLPKGYVFSEKARLNMSLAALERSKRSDVHFNAGRIHSKESRKNMSEAAKARVYNGAHHNSGRIHSEEARANMSAAKKDFWKRRKNLDVN